MEIGIYFHTDREKGMSSQHDRVKHKLADVKWNTLWVQSPPVFINRCGKPCVQVGGNLTTFLKSRGQKSITIQESREALEQLFIQMQSESKITEQEHGILSTMLCHDAAGGSHTVTKHYTHTDPAILAKLTNKVDNYMTTGTILT